MQRTDETRKVLKVFGVAVTDFEAESERLLAALEAAPGSTAETMRALRDALDLLREVNRTWLAATQHLAGLQQRFLERAAAALPGPNEPRRGT
ncbi:MAG: hypothetical protein ACREKI_03245 [Gemmatimonadota bacterium]